LGFEGYTFDGPHLLGVIVFAGVIAIACLGCCVFHMCCAASEGHSSVRLGGLPKKNQVAMEDPDDGQAASDAIVAALHPYFTTRKADGNWPGVGDHADTANLDEYGIEKNLLTQGDKHKKEALDLLTRGISIEQTLDRKGIYGKGGDDLQKDPMAAYGLSRPTKRIKAFISHTWDATDAAGKSPSAIAADRLSHADNTTKAIMWHIKFKVTLFSMLICQVLLLAGMGISVMFGVLVGLLPLFALPLWVVKTKNPRLFWWLGLKGPQFWMDKAVVHQANFVDTGNAPMGEVIKGTGFKYLDFFKDIKAINDAGKGPEILYPQISKYRPLNSAGVGLFAHFLDISDEMWVLFTERYITRIWCVYEMAVWLRQMKKHPKKKIKLIPLNLNSTLFRIFPFLQLIVGIMAGLAGTFGNYGLPHTHASSHQMSTGLAWIIIFGVWAFVLCAGAATFVFVYRQIVAPAKKEQARVRQAMTSFSIHNTKAAVPFDIDLVKGLVVKMWRKEAGANASDADVLAAFDKEVRTEVAAKLDGLINSQIRSFTISFAVAVLMIVVVDVAMVVMNVLDVVRPILTPTAAFWGRSDQMLFTIIGLAAIVPAYVAFCCWFTANHVIGEQSPHYGKFFVKDFKGAFNLNNFVERAKKKDTTLGLMSTNTYWNE